MRWIVVPPRHRRQTVAGRGLRGTLPWMSTDDPDRAAILARRQRFVAIALSSLATGGVACTKPQPCLDVQRAPGPTESKAKPQPCLDIQRPPEEGKPRPCLNVSAPGEDPGPEDGKAQDGKAQDGKADAPAEQVPPHACLKIARPPTSG
jgi:hypothetical protein